MVGSTIICAFCHGTFPSLFAHLEEVNFHEGDQPHVDPDCDLCNSEVHFLPIPTRDEYNLMRAIEQDYGSNDG